VAISARHVRPFAQAQQQQAQSAPQNAKPAQSESAPPASPQGPVVPSDKELVVLIFSTLIALNQANTTGNYTVLRDLGAPGFQSANSSTGIAGALATLRPRNLNLSAILLFQPKFLRKPDIDAQGMLRATGHFTTRPRVNFDLIFQFVGGRWRLFGMAVDTSQTLPPADSAGQTAPPQAAKPKQAVPAKPAPAAKAAPDVRKVQQLDAAVASAPKRCQN
jgi:hypothetical protein